MFVIPIENFLEHDTGSKRLLSTVYKQLEEKGYDIAKIKASINDTVRKTVIAMEPYLVQNYNQRVTREIGESKNFQILGVDILLDKKLRAWLMEVNSNPSLNMFLEKDSGPIWAN